MIAAESVTAVLLAAGLSRRFGAVDKLDAPLGGIPLRLHAAHTLAGIGFGRLIAVCRADDPALRALGVEIIVNPAPEDGQASSIRLGVSASDDPAILIALADMPFLTTPHLLALLDAFTPGGAVASHDGTRPMPPALFDRRFAPQLAALDGDQGARDLLLGATFVFADPAILADIDSPDQLPSSTGPVAPIDGAR